MLHYHNFGMCIHVIYCSVMFQYCHHCLNSSRLCTCQMDFHHIYDDYTAAKVERVKRPMISSKSSNEEWTYFETILLNSQLVDVGQ